MLVTSLNRRQPSNLREKWSSALRGKASTRTTSSAHTPTSPREPLLESKEAAKGRPQSKHCCFASVIRFPFISLECFPEAGEYHTPPSSWETGAGREGHLPRSPGPAAGACILLERHTPTFPMRCHVERDLLCCFSLCPSVAAMGWLLVCLMRRTWHAPPAAGTSP